MSLYKQNPNEPNYVALVNQIIDVLNGVADAGTISLLAQITAPGAPTLAAAAGTELGIGTYYYKVTFLTGSVKGDGSLNIIGETQGGTAASVTTSSGNQRVSITNIPVGPTGTIGRRIYRTAVGGAQGTEKLAITIADNTTTSYTDTVADGSLGAAVPTTNSTGTRLVQSEEDSLIIEVAKGIDLYEPDQVDTSLGPAIEFADAVTRSVTFCRRWPWDIYGVAVDLVIAADTANAGSFRVRVAYQINGGSATNVDVTVTPGNNTNLYTAALGTIISAAALAAGDLITITLSRLGGDAADTHTGKMRLYQTRMKRV